MMIVRLLAHTKLYWGLAALFLYGALSSPVTSHGINIFLSSGNLSDVLREVSITGLAAVGMTLVILIGGIDLSVGSILGCGSVIAALLLTQSGWNAGAVIGVPTAIAVTFVVAAALTRFVVSGMKRAQFASEMPTRSGLATPLVAALVCTVPVAFWLGPSVHGKFGVLGVMYVVPCVGLAIGALNGSIIVIGRLQPFIVTLAAMVSLIGVGRLVAGQDSAVIAVYSGTNATPDIDILRQVIWGFIPIPGLFFIGALVVFTVVLKFTVFGRYVYALGGNEEATRLSGIGVMPVKIATYAFSGLLSALAAVLFVAQYRQGKPDAGTGLELDAIAAVVIGGTSLMGGRGSLAGTLVGVLIFGILTNILELHDISTDFQLVLKGVIIVAAVLLQERDLGQILAPVRRTLALRTKGASKDGLLRPEANQQGGKS